MKTIICNKCNIAYEIDDSIWETEYSHIEFFQCSNCGAYIKLKHELNKNNEELKHIHSSKKNSSALEKNNSFNFFSELIDIELLIFFFKLTWMRYKHPIARLFDKIGTINLLIFYMCAFFCLIQLILDSHIGVGICSRLLIFSVLSVITNKILAAIFNKFFKEDKIN